eukprot:sb/3476376/
MRKLSFLLPAVRNKFTDAPEAPPEVFEVFVDSGPLFKPEAMKVFEEQMRMHLQLLVQHCILAKGWPELESTTGKQALSLIDAQIGPVCRTLRFVEVGFPGHATARKPTALEYVICNV